jgi:ABC-type uncharacterized transport system auxiliary subunit
MTPTSTRRDALRRLSLGAVALLGGCGLDPSPRIDYQVLRDTGKSAAAAARIDKVLLLAIEGTPALYDSERMVFSADGKSRSYFQYGFWSERPARRLLTLAESRLAGAQLFRSVALSTSGVRGALLLNLRLQELYLDDSTAPGRVHLAFSAELIDWLDRRLLARRGFSRVLDVMTRDAAGLALAASQASSALLDELVAWTAAAAAPASAA